MMPVNNAFPIEELIQACKDYIEKHTEEYHLNMH